MLGGGVIQHDVQHDLHATSVRSLDESIEVGERTELRIHVLVIRNVVPKIRLRRWIKWRDPNGIHAKVGQIVEALADPVQIPNTVVVAVLKAPNVELVED